MSVSLILLLTLCSISTLGFVFERPTGSCPKPLEGISCMGRTIGCKDNQDCTWNKICCFNGCQNECITISEGSPSWPRDRHKFWPDSFPQKPPNPFKPPPDPLPRPFEPPPNPLPKPFPPPPINFSPFNPGDFSPDNELLPAFNDFH